MPGGVNYKKPKKSTGSKSSFKKVTVKTKAQIEAEKKALREKKKAIAKNKAIEKAKTAVKPVDKKKPPTKPVTVTKNKPGAFGGKERVINPDRRMSKTKYERGKESDQQYFDGRNVGFVPKDKNKEIAIAFGDTKNLKNVNQAKRNKAAAKKKEVAKAVAKKKTVAKAKTAKKPIVVKKRKVSKKY